MGKKNLLVAMWPTPIGHCFCNCKKNSRLIRNKQLSKISTTSAFVPLDAGDTRFLF